MPLHRLTRSTLRHTTRWHTRLSPGARRPDYLGDVIRLAKSIIRARRRLMRLVPELFDPVLSAREDARFAETARRHREVSAVISKVYQVPMDQVPLASPSENPFWCNKGEEKVKRLTVVCAALSPEQREAVDQLLARITEYTSAKNAALATYRRMRPHDIPSFSRIATLIEIAIAFGRIACGLETTQPIQDPSADMPDDQFERDLARAYPPPPHAPEPAATPGTNQPANTKPDSARIKSRPVPLPPSAPPDPHPLEPTPPRCDAFSRAARQLGATRQLDKTHVHSR